MGAAEPKGLKEDSEQREEVESRGVVACPCDSKCACSDEEEDDRVTLLVRNLLTLLFMR